MALSNLPTSTSNGSGQSTTQNPQAATAANGIGGGQPTSSVQPGTSTALLNSSHGTPLSATRLTTIPLATTTSTGKVTTAPTTHHANVGVLVIAAILVIAAVALFAGPLISNNTDKTTTK